MTNVSVLITFRNTDATEALRTYATEKITHAIERLVHRPTKAHVVLVVEKNEQRAECTVHADGSDLHVSERADSLYTAIDALAGTLQQQVRRHKEKLTAHH